MKYRNIILCALLIPRLDFMDISGVNSAMRLDVVGLALVSTLPLFKSISYSTITVVFSVLFFSLIQMFFFDVQSSRMAVGVILYLSIILFSQYHKIISLDDVIYICRWFLVVNSVAHIFEIFITGSLSSDLSPRYGIFNQHFAFASAILISYFFLYYHNARDKWVDALFIISFVLSGSRGLIVAVGMCIILANINIIKNLRSWAILILFLTLTIVSIFYFAPDNVHLVRLVKAFTVITEGLSEVTAILLDPAINVRVENIFHYFEFVETLDNSMLYMIIGGGPYSFLDHSIQYQKPGHFDNLYFRILSEYGVISLVFIMTLILVCVRRSKLTVWYAIALLTGALVSEAILALKVGHLFFLTLFFLKDPKDPNVKNI